MGAAARQVITETDDDDDDVVEQPGGEQPAAAPTLRPLESPPIQREQPAAGEAPEYEIVETDDAGTPHEREESLGGTPAGGENLLQRRERETREAQALGISRSSLRRKKANDARRTSNAEIARLRDENSNRDREIADLRGRLEKVEPRLSEFDAARQQGQLQQVDQALEIAQRALNECDDRSTKAMQDNDPEAFRKAQSEGREAFLNVERLKFQKKQLAATPARTTAAAAPAARETEQTEQPAGGKTARAEPRRLSAQAQSYTDDFIEDHAEWFNPAGGDADSDVVLAIDNLVARRGFKPDTPEYWAEVDRRLRVELPHRFVDTDETRGAQRASATPARAATEQVRASTVPAQRRGPMTAGAGDSSAGRGKVKVHIDPARKEALIQGGYVNPDGSVPDPAKLDRVLAKYAQADRERQAERR